MPKTGKDNLLPESQPATPDQVRVPLRVLVIGVVAVLFALVVGTQVIGVLYAIFFPPAAPRPAQAEEVSHSGEAFGVDDWLYRTDLPVCDVVQFYIDNGGECRIVPGWCGTQSQSGGTDPGADTPNQNVARCSADVKFSIFALRWQAVIATGSTSADATQFRVNREIFWTGTAPPVSQFQP